jgi:PAS domain S-box-containing protein/putative nucleotidyltransferase with HDIG domain
MLDEDGRYVRWNSYQRDEIVGKSDDLIVATSPVDTIHPDDRALIGARFANVIENGGVEIVEGRVLLGGGPAFKWFLMTGRRIMIDDRPFLVGSGIDITDRKQAETELKHSRRLLHSSIESLSDTVLLAIDREYRYLTFSKAHWQAMHHAYSADIEIGANTLGFIGSDDDRQIAKEGYDRAMRGESYSQIAVYGTVHPAYYESFFNPILDDDEIIGATCLSRDITERKRAEQALRASEEQLDRAIVGSGVGLWDWQIESDSAVFNERYAEMVGYTLGELAPLSAGAWMSLCHPDDRQRALGGLERHRTGQSEAYECEVRLRHKDGHWVWILDRGKATERNSDGCATRMIGTHLDISARKQAEQALRESLGAQEAVTAGVIEALVRSVEARDPFTAGHQRRVSELAVAMARRLGLDEDRVEARRVGGLLHDVGKITIPAEILSKPGRLTVMEFALIKGHAEAGEEILQAIPFPWPIAAMAAQHHEREDGSGYPNGLRGEAILPEARLLAVADVVEAMASHRPYRPAPGIEAALAEIHGGAGTRYDAAVVAACEQVFAEGFGFGDGAAT